MFDYHIRGTEVDFETLPELTPIDLGLDRSRLMSTLHSNLLHNEAHNLRLW